jgi:hypothetical protein
MGFPFGTWPIRVYKSPPPLCRSFSSPAVRRSRAARSWLDSLKGKVVSLMGEKKNFFHGKITGKSWVSGQDVPFNQSNDSRGLLLCTTILTQKTQVEKVTRNVIRSFPRGNPWISIVNHRIWECCVTIRISHWIPIKSPCSEMNPLTWSDWKWDIPQKNHQPIPILIVWPSGYLT